jgi:hypothetical protein
MRAFFFLIPAALGVFSCTSSDKGLGNGTFSYECVSAPSGGCASGAVAVPASIVAGTRFKVTYAPTDTSSFPSATVAPVSADYLAPQTDGSLVALQAGTSYVFSTSKGLALDIAPITVIGTVTGTAPVTKDAGN